MGILTKNSSEKSKLTHLDQTGQMISLNSSDNIVFRCQIDVRLLVRVTNSCSFKNSFPDQLK